MSETPRTDELLKGKSSAYNADVVGLLELSRKLEIENQHAEKRIRELKQDREILRQDGERWREIANRKISISTDNPWCSACRETDCVVSIDGTCAMIRKYLTIAKP